MASLSTELDRRPASSTIVLNHNGLRIDLVIGLQLAQISIAVEEGFRNFQPLIFNLGMAEA